MDILLGDLWHHLQVWPKTIEMKITTHQGIMLFPSNKSGRLSYEDIKSQLKEEDEDIIGVLYSIAYIESTKFYQKRQLPKQLLQVKSSNSILPLHIH